MSWLATWFIFELIGVRGWPDIKPQTFKKVSLQMMVYQTITVCHIFHKKLHHIKFSSSDMNGQNGSGRGALSPFGADIFLLCYSHEALLRTLVFYFMQEHLTVNLICCNIMSVWLNSVVFHLHSIITIVIFDGDVHFRRSCYFIDFEFKINGYLCCIA